MSRDNLRTADDSVIKNSHTFKEIFAQPELWRRIHDQSWHEVVPADFFSDSTAEYILSGAGSSAFVAETLAIAMQSRLSGHFRAAATTDIVTHPTAFFRNGRKQTMISFARSGNSPESVAAVKLASEINPEVTHLIITCNRDGALAKLKIPPLHLAILPEEANDRGLAMIGSVSGMILVAYLMSRLIRSRQGLTVAERFFQDSASIDLVSDIARLPFERVVVLGSGSFLGLAREGHLKIQELSDGQVIGKHDSYLGFRHGPKAVINDKTLIIYLVSPLPYVREYELDLMRTIREEKTPLRTLAISDAKDLLPADAQISLEFGDAPVTEEDRLLPFLLPVQLLAAMKSRYLGLNPDSPSARGAIHRVVQGVRIHPFKGED